MLKILSISLTHWQGQRQSRMTRPLFCWGRKNSVQLSLQILASVNKALTSCNYLLITDDLRMTCTINTCTHILYSFLFGSLLYFKITIFKYTNLFSILAITQITQIAQIAYYGECCFESVEPPSYNIARFFGMSLSQTLMGNFFQRGFLYSGAYKVLVLVT